MSIGIYIIFSIFLLMGPACSQGGGCKGLFRADKGGVPVTVEKVRVKEVSPVITISGTLVPNDKADIKFPHEARIADVFAKVGSRILEGDPLFRLAEDELNNDLNVARARKAELEALIDKNTNLLRSRERLLEEGKIDQGELTRLEKEIALDEAELTRINAEISKLSYNLEHVVVNSPVAGVVVRKNISPGSVAGAGEVLLSIVDVNPIIISFPLNAKQSEDIAIDTPLKIFVNELPDKSFDAKVTYVSPELHRAGNTFDVWAAIPNDDFLLKAGMTASTEFVSDTLKHTYIIPASSVMSKSSQPYVYKVSKGIVHKTPIVIGSISGDQVEVVRGLDVDDIVVAKGGEDLFDGADVNIWRR